MHPLLVITAALAGLAAGQTKADDEQKLKFADCPPGVQQTLKAEAKGAKVETVTKEKSEEGETLFWADVTIAGKTYAIGVLEDGTLTEMNQAIDDKEIPLDRCPKAVQTGFRAEAFGERVGAVEKDLRYGVTIYEAVVEHKGKSYEIVIAEDGTLVEKVLVIEDEEVELANCPPAVQTALREHANGGKIGEVTRSSGIGRHTFEAEIEIKGKVYLVEVAENGLLISKSLEAGAE